MDIQWYEQARLAHEQPQGTALPVKRSTIRSTRRCWIEGGDDRRARKSPACSAFVNGSDGTRTRDLRRDRPAF
jgi:hypothetical protein